MTDADYNFKNCKLCSGAHARPQYVLEFGTIYCCARCDFHFLDHLDGQTTTPDSTIIDDNIRNYIDRRSDESIPFHRQRIELLKQHISIPGTNCLDIGAGTGQFQMMLAGLGAKKTLGIEPSVVRRNYAFEKHGLKLIPETIESSYWQDSYLNSFSIITLWDVVEHVDFPGETLLQAARLLKPGGILALDTPGRDVPSYRISERLYRLTGGRLNLFLSNFYSKAPFGHKQIFTRQQMLDLCSHSGLEVSHQTDNYTKGIFKGKKSFLWHVKAADCCSPPKGWFKRFLESLAKANNQHFGDQPPKCH